MNKLKSVAEKVKIGTRFGCVMVISGVYNLPHGGKNPRQRTHCMIRCLCGNEEDILCSNLHDERIFCNRCRVKHDRDSKLLYHRWRGLLNRCYDPRNDHFHLYGGRGIAVCEEWRNNFFAFREWALANGYQRHLQIDRRDNNKGYCPDNCRWVTRSENGQNKRNNVWIAAFGETQCLADWAKDHRCVVARKVLMYRLKHGWDSEKAITKPPSARH